MKFTFGPESRPLDGFTIKRAIARGGFGEVYYALTDSGKEVAIKLLQENLEVELRGVSQCLNLKHPNLVTIFDIKQDRDGDHWIVMEFVGGQTLDRVIHEHSNGLPLADVVAWLDGIAAGIGFLHDRGIVHRDLKPANIFRENGVVKVGDVGLSKFIAPSRRSAHTQSVGTVYYMAPEVAKGRYGREVDVYSLAVILYELLTGKVPFDGETTAEILMKHLTERPDLAPIPPQMRPLFERALEKDPQRRLADVTELARIFRAMATGIGSVELPVPREVQTAREKTPPLPILPPSEGGTKGGRAAVDRDPEVPRLPDTVRLDGDRHVPRGTVFPEPKRPESRWERICRSSGRGVGSLWTLWRVHPLLIMAGVVTLCLWTWPQSTRAGFMLVPSYGVRGLWFLAAVVVAIEIFRGVSRGVDWMFLPDRGANGGERFQKAVRLNPVVPPVQRSSGYRAVDPNTVRDVSWRRRVTEMSGSFTTAGFATALVTLVLSYVTHFFDTTALAGHFAAGTLIGSWGLLLVCKLREGLPRERYIDRVLLGGLGILVGIALFQLDEWLLIDLPTDGWSNKDSLIALPITSITSRTSSAGPRDILLESYVAFVATLFGLRRWWWHADSFRRHRFRVLSVALTALIGAVAARLWGFPVLWGTVWAASLSSVVQLAAAWSPPEQRR